MNRVESLIHSERLKLFLLEQQLGVPIKRVKVIAPERRPDGTMPRDGIGPVYALLIGEPGYEIDLRFRSPTYRQLETTPIPTDELWPACFDYDCRLLVGQIRCAIEIVGPRNLLIEKDSIV